MSFKKNLEPEDVLISSFETHKTFTLNEADSGSGIYAMSLIKPTDSNLHNFDINTAATTTISSSIFYSAPTYQTIHKLYYRDITQMRGNIDYIRGVPTASDAVLSYTYTEPLSTLDNSTRRRTYGLRRPYTRQLHDTATIISVPQKLYGERVRPTSVRITDDSTASTLILQDDGRGNLYDVAFSSSYANHAVSAQGSGSVVGNFFYDDGLAVITNTGSYKEVGTHNGSDGFTIKFDSTQTIYEREYVCRAGENEFLHTTNNSIKQGYSSSVAISGFEQSIEANSMYDNFNYNIIGYATSSWSTSGYEIGTQLIGAASHSEFATYVTNVILYNDANEMLAIGKLAKPVKNDKELALAFVVRFDTN
tara:strand:+ start:69 stop:1160 length:1092 start_codon:yes stop_codon:yes gene_type:complete